MHEFFTITTYKMKKIVSKVKKFGYQALEINTKPLD